MQTSQSTPLIRRPAGTGTRRELSLTTQLAGSSGIAAAPKPPRRQPICCCCSHAHLAIQQSVCHDGITPSTTKHITASKRAHPLAGNHRPTYKTPACCCLQVVVCTPLTHMTAQQQGQPCTPLSHHLRRQQQPGAAAAYNPRGLLVFCFSILLLPLKPTTQSAVAPELARCCCRQPWDVSLAPTRSRWRCMQRHTHPVLPDYNR